MTGPEQLTLRAVNSSSVEVNWTQPVSVPTVSSQYRVNNYNITCTSSHSVYTTTSQHVTTPAVNESTHIHMIISGLMSNTSYTCCVSAYSELGTSESVCDTVIITGMTVYTCLTILLLFYEIDKDSNTTIDVKAILQGICTTCSIIMYFILELYRLADTYSSIMGGWSHHWSCAEYSHIAHSVSSCVSVEEEEGSFTTQHV